MSPSEKQRDLEKTLKLISILDNLLANPDWDETIFLRTAKKRIVALREEAEVLAKELGAGAEEVVGVHKIVVPEGHIKVFIALYQTEGNNLQIWQNLLKSLTKHSISRPVYAEEEHVREVVRSKPAIERHAYAVVAILESDIIYQANPPLDNLGHELLTLREGSVKPDNILEFVHANKKHYIYQNNLLTPV